MVEQDKEAAGSLLNVSQDEATQAGERADSLGPSLPFTIRRLSL
jgi:hypothetical protein